MAETYLLGRLGGMSPFLGPGGDLREWDGVFLAGTCGHGAGGRRVQFSACPLLLPSGCLFPSALPSLPPPPPVLSIPLYPLPLLPPLSPSYSCAAPNPLPSQSGSWPLGWRGGLGPGGRCCWVPEKETKLKLIVLVVQLPSQPGTHRLASHSLRPRLPPHPALSSPSEAPTPAVGRIGLESTSQVCLSVQPQG